MGRMLVSEREGVFEFQIFLPSSRFLGGEFKYIWKPPNLGSLPGLVWFGRLSFLSLQAFIGKWGLSIHWVYPPIDYSWVMVNQQWGVLGLSNHSGMWPLATVTAPGHLNDNSLPESTVSPFATGETVTFLCRSQQGGWEPTEGACLKHAVSCPRGTTAAGWTEAWTPPPVWLEVKLWNLECCLLPRWLLVCLVSRTLHCQADPLAAGGTVVSTLAPEGKRELS